MNASTRSPLRDALELAEGRGHVLASNGAIAGLVHFYRPIARETEAREVATPLQRAELGAQRLRGGTGSTKNGNNTRSACEM